MSRGVNSSPLLHLARVRRSNRFVAAIGGFGIVALAAFSEGDSEVAT